MKTLYIDTIIKKILVCALVLFSLFFVENANAQNPFPYNEGFTRSAAQTPDLVLGGQAVLTGGSIDPADAGYLRLTTNLADQTGFARSLTYFPSTNGVEVSFEYFIYTPGDEITLGADGIVFFLFDAAAASRGVVAPYATGGFNIGGFGGSLGYAQFQKDGVGTTFPGVSQGYLGIGIDAFGNFSNGTETRNLGDGARRESSLSLRGAGDGFTGYTFLKKVTTQEGGAPGHYDFTNVNGPIHQQETENPSVYDTESFLIEGRKSGRNGGPGGVALLPTHPGYRKIRIIMETRAPDPGYKITVWITAGGKTPTLVDPSMPAGTYRLLREFVYATPPPTNLGFGFGAATGSSVNFHEIRNIEAVVPASSPQRPILANIPKTGLQNATITFTKDNFTSKFLDPNGINTLTEVEIVTLPSALQGVLKLNGVDITPLQKIPENQLQNITFVPANNFTGTVGAFQWNGFDNTSPATQNALVNANINITITGVPSIQLTNIGVCEPAGATADLVYTNAAFSPTEYRIDFNPAAEAVGFTDVAYTALPASPIVITMGGTAVVGTAYSANLYVRDVSLTESAAIPFTVRVKPYAVATDITVSAPVVCSGSGAVFTPSAAGITSPVYTWYTNANKTGPISTGGAFTVSGAGVLTVTGLGVGTHTYYAAVSGIEKCENQANNLRSATITVRPFAVAADLTVSAPAVCSGSSAVLTPTSSGITTPVYTWYTNANKTGPIVTGGAFTVSGAGVLTVTGLAAGSYTYYAGVSGVEKCENQANNLRSATITVKPYAVAADITISAPAVCSGSSAVLTPTSSGITTPVYTWYSNADKTGPIVTGGAFTVSGAGVLTVTGLAPGSYTYHAAVSGVEKCENQASTLRSVTVMVKPFAVATDITVAGAPSGSVCAGSGAVLTPTAAGITNPVYTWYANADRTGLITTGVSAGVLTLSNLPAGTNNYYVSVSGDEKCENAANTLKLVSIVVAALPTASISYSGGPFCPTGSIAVTQTGQTGGTYSSTTGLTINATTGLITLSSSTPGVYTVTYSFSNGACSNTTTTSVTINAIPTVAAITGASSTNVGGSTPFSNTTSGGIWSSDNTAVATVNSSGVVTGVSVGTAVITYTVTSGGCSNSVTKSITITAAPVNAPPVVQNITKSGLRDQTIAFTAANFSDANAYSDPENVALVKIRIVSLPANGILKLDGVNITANQEIPAADLAKITFVPTSGFTGTTTFDWNGSDGVNYAVTPKLVSITLTAPSTTNTLPIIADINKTGTKDIPVPFTSTDFTDKFTDSSPLVKITVVTLPPSGTLRLNGVNITAGQEIPLADLAKITFVPATGFTGGPVSFQWNGSDGTDYANTPKNVNITINAVNTAPVAANDTYTTTKGGTLTVALPGVLTNDTDPEGNALTAIKVTNPPNGTVTLNANGSFVYTHNGGSSNSDVFTYKVNDGSVDGNTVSVTITISSANGPPVVTDLQKIGTGLTPITFTAEDFRGKYTDPNSDPLVKVLITSLPPVGTLRLSGVPVVVGQEIPVANLGNLTFDSPVNWTGTTAFGWNGFDGLVYATNSANVNLQVPLSGDPTAKIGLAKSLASVTPATNGTYDVKFIFTAINYGVNALENISIRDNLLLAFGGATVTVKSIVGFGNLKANNSFNGSSDTELLLSTSKLNPSEQARLELVINVKLGSTGGLYQNTATAQGTSSVNGLKVTDVSTNGLKPDPLTANDVSPLEATPIQLDPQPSFVPQGFSPNGDGQNDKFVIQNAQGKLVSLEIYNRWGNRVYKSADYKNDWGGEVTEGFFLGRDIPDGTYYYIILIENKDRYTGFITINR